MTPKQRAWHIADKYCRGLLKTGSSVEFNVLVGAIMGAINTAVAEERAALMERFRKLADEWGEEATLTTQDALNPCKTQKAVEAVGRRESYKNAVAIIEARGRQ